jgi:hypothetical protein
MEIGAEIETQSLDFNLWRAREALDVAGARCFHDGSRSLMDHPCNGTYAAVGLR